MTSSLRLVTYLQRANRASDCCQDVIMTWGWGPQETVTQESTEGGGRVQRERNKTSGEITQGGRVQGRNWTGKEEELPRGEEWTSLINDTRAYSLCLIEEHSICSS